MATFFNTAISGVDSTAGSLISSTSDSTILLSLLVANRDGNNPADVTVSHREANGTDIQNFLAYTITVPADANVEILSNKYIVPSGQRIFVESNQPGLLDAAASFVVV